jgi:hypothetical protein
VSHVAASSFLFSLLFFGTYRFFNMELGRGQILGVGG